MDEINDQLIDNIKQNNIDEVIRILDEGVDINYMSNVPIRLAIKLNKYEITKILIDHNANIDHSYGILLHFACVRGHNEIVGLLLNEGINYNKEIYGSLIEPCISNDDVDSLRLLIQFNLEELTVDENIRLKSDYEETIWDACLEYKAKNIIEFIINNYSEIIPENINEFPIKQQDIQTYNFIKMLINRNFIDVPD